MPSSVGKARVAAALGVFIFGVAPQVVAQSPEQAPPEQAPPAAVDSDAQAPATANPPAASPPSPRDAAPPAPTTGADVSDPRWLEQPAPRTRPDTPPAELTTNVWHEPRPPFELVWHLLALPERLIEVAFSPIGLLVITTERYRLDKRYKDLTEFYGGKIELSPRLKLGLGDGLGLGATLSLNSLFGQDNVVDISGLYRFDGDYELRGRYQDTYPRLEGRQLAAEAEWELDGNQRWFGIGADTEFDDRRVLRSESLLAVAALDLTGLGVEDVFGSVELGFRRQTLTTGTDRNIPGFMVGDVAGVPPGFGDTHNYPQLQLVALYDSRDVVGTPSRGALASLAGGITSDVGGADLNALTASIAYARYIAVLPRHRTLVVRLGSAVAQPFTRDGEVPLHQLVTLGRENHLRGYAKDRFRGNWGWWGNLEYQYQVWEYMTTNVILSTLVFVDVGGIGDTPRGLVDEFLYSYGVGLRGAHETKRGLDVTLGRSPEGLEFKISIGKEL